MTRQIVIAALKLTRRELSTGLKGFWVYVTCLAIGAFAISASGSVTRSFNEGLQAQSRMLLGGDAAFVAAQRLATDEERAFLASRGTVSETASLDVMGAKDGVRKQVDIQAVDEAYPLLGTVVLNTDGTKDEASEATTGVSVQSTLEKRGGVWGIAVSRSLLETFPVTIGDQIKLGPLDAEIRAILIGEPDEIGEPGAFGPRALVSIEALKEAGRLTNGQLFRSSYRLLLPNGAEDFDRLARASDETWGNRGMRLRSPEDAVDGLSDILQMLNAFLAVIGIAALAAGGIGVAQATESFLEKRISSIAALKALGVDGNVIGVSYALQLGLLASFGAIVGVALGAASPFLLDLFAGDRIPLPQVLGFYAAPAFKAFALAIMSAMIFASPALGQARTTPPSVLFRSNLHAGKSKIPMREKLITAGAIVALVATATVTSSRPIVTLGLLVGAATAYGLLLSAAQGIRLLAGRLGAAATGVQRIALFNLSGPQSLAPIVAPALGLGLALLTLVAAVQENLIRQIKTTAPANAPSIVFTQIPNLRTQQFDAILDRFGIDTNNTDTYRRAPIALARIVGIKGADIDPAKIAPSEQWVVESEVALTYLADAPPESRIVSGAWWDTDYKASDTAPLLVSVESDAAKGLGLDIGDLVDFRIFGRTLSAEIASLRTVDWGGFGANVTFILSPGALEAANPQHFAIARTDATIESDIISVLETDFPNVVVFQTREALAAAAAVLADISIAVNAAASVVTASGLLVLIGAFASIARKRRSEAALVKVFGADRSDLVTLYAVEFGIAGIIAAFIGTALGLAAAVPIVVTVFEASWTTPWQSIAVSSTIAILSASVGGGIVGLNAIREKPSAALRAA